MYDVSRIPSWFRKVARQTLFQPVFKSVGNSIADTVGGGFAPALFG